jgi:hypothetical protein
MRILNLLVPVSLLASSIVPSVQAIFADEAFEIDYQHQLLGLPLPHTTFFHRPRREDKASLLYSLSERGVVGAVNPGSGAIVWRQLLEQTQTVEPGRRLQGYLRAAEGGTTVVSALGGSVHAWDALTGREAWSRSFEGVAKDLEIYETPGEEVHKDVLVLSELSGGGVLRRLSGATGRVVWEHELLGADVPFQVSTDIRHIFVVSLHGARGGYNLKVTTLDPLTGNKLEDHLLQSKVDVHKEEDVLFVGANVASPIIAWTDAALKTLKVNILGTTQVFSFNMNNSGDDIEKVVIHAPHILQAQPHFLVHCQTSTAHWADVYHTNIKAATVEQTYHLPKLPGPGAFSTSSQDANVYFTRHTEDEVILVASTSHGVLGRWPMAHEKSSSVAHGVSEAVSRPGNTYAVRSAVVTSDDDWEMIRNGASAWTRPEGLAGAIAAAWADIPEAEDLVKTLEAEAHSSPLAAYIHRVNRHLNDLQYLPAYLQRLPQVLLSSILPKDKTKSDSDPVVRDNFGFHKLAVVATERGRVYVLDTGSQGKILSSVQAVNLPAGQQWDVRGMIVNNTEGTVTIMDRDGVEVTLKTMGGSVVSAKTPEKPVTVQSTAVVESSSGRWLLAVDADGNPVSTEKHLPPNNVVVVPGAALEVKGLAFGENNGKSVHFDAWTFRPGAGQRITHLTSRPRHDPVASIGKVQPDRTVLYKYLNPNMVLITAVHDVDSAVFFYLLDSVSGEILYSTSHESVDLTQPITSLLSENWLVYSLWSDVGKNDATQFPKGYQLVVFDLYESPLTNDRGPLGSASNFSSLQPSNNPGEEPVLPHVISQAFIIPEAISSMAVTQTKQGITSRQLLCTLPASNAIVGITRNVLDPRRPVGRDPTPGEMEEGLMKYNPVIEFDPKMMLTHKREVMGVKRVITSPSLLESTSLVLAYGLDVFGTRVAPSFAFDVLGKDFNRVGLVLTVVALFVGVTAVAPMVSYSHCITRALCI